MPWKNGRSTQGKRAKRIGEVGQGRERSGENAVILYSIWESEVEVAGLDVETTTWHYTAYKSALQNKAFGRHTVDCMI